MDPIISQILGAVIYGLAAFAAGYVVGHYGLAAIETDLAYVKNDVLNLKLQSPVTVTPIVTQTTNPASTSSTPVSGATVLTPAAVAPIVH